MPKRTTILTLLGLLVASQLVLGQQPPVASVKVAAVQLLGYDKTELPRAGYDPVADVVRYVERAAQDKVQLVVFPEYLLGHIRVPGPETQRIAAAADKGNLYVIVGCWEMKPGDAYANAALLFDRSGKIVGKYYKVHAAVDRWSGDPPWTQPLAGKDLEWFKTHDPEWKMEPGQGFPVFDLDFGKVGILTCYDGWFPESFRTLALDGAELLVWINGRRGTVEDFIVRAEVFRNEVAIVTTNQAYGAGTMIAQWPHQLLAHAAQPKEEYLTAKIDMQRIRRARQFSRNAAQRRPDVYGVITQPK
jgi:predicted amidohydrolase